jgi:hypothetical protein
MSTEVYETIIGEYEGFKIVLTAEPEYEAIEAETSEHLKWYMERFEDGRLMWFCAHVSAQKYGLALGESFLGCCAYESLAEFKKHSGYYRDMRDEAVSEAKAKLAEIIAGENDG